MKDIIGDYETFIGNINTGLTAASIQREELAMMDHLCYRVETTYRYTSMRDALGPSQRYSTCRL